MVDIKEAKRKRFDFLRTLFDDSGGDTRYVSFIADMGRELGFDPNEAEKIAQYLDEEGLIEIMDKIAT